MSKLIQLFKVFWFCRTTESGGKSVGSWQLAINTIEITDLLGRVMLKQSVTPAAKKVVLNVSALSNGVYFIKVFSTQGAVTVRKVVKE